MEIILQIVIKFRIKKVAHTYAGYVVAIAYRLGQQSITNFPRKDAGTFTLIVGDLLHDRCGGNARFRSANGTRLYRASLIVSVWNVMGNVC